MRVITTTDSTVTGVKWVNDGYILQDGEFETELGEIGQVKQDDGSFVDGEKVETEPEPTTAEIVMANYIETQYQTILIEMSMT
jgi:hypothetical protein